MTNEELQRLKALALAATPGPWYVQFGDDIRYQCMTAISPIKKRDGNDGIFNENEPLIAVTFHQSYPAVNIEGDDCGDNDSAYIAAANPKTILELIDAFCRLSVPVDLKSIHSAVLAMKPDLNPTDAQRFAFNGAVHMAAAVVSGFSSGAKEE